MKALIPLMLYAAVSWLLGLIVCVVMARRRRSTTGLAMAAALLFGGPVATYLYLYIQEGMKQRQFQEDVAYVKELCAKHGGDKIYRTVDNVEGVFQIKPRAPVTDAMWRDQYGMSDPWGRAQLDSDYPAIAIGPKSAEQGLNGYWFIEQYAELKEQPPYARRFSMSRFEPVTSVNNLRSRYGYLTEDLSTPEMRKRWIGGGRIKIIDLQTKEVLAERTGYFRALGPEYRDSWGGVPGTTQFCPQAEYMDAFIRKVLRPKQALPAQEDIDSLKKD